MTATFTPIPASEQLYGYRATVGSYTVEATRAFAGEWDVYISHGDTTLMRQGDNVPSVVRDDYAHASLMGYPTAMRIARAIARKLTSLPQRGQRVRYQDEGGIVHGITLDALVLVHWDRNASDVISRYPLERASEWEFIPSR